MVLENENIVKYSYPIGIKICEILMMGNPMVRKEKQYQTNIGKEA